MMHRVLLRLSSAASFYLVLATIIPRAGSAGANKHDRQTHLLRGGSVPKKPLEVVSGHYFGLTFRDDPFAINIWDQKKSDRLVDNLDPVAPMDRMDKTYITSWSGAAPVEPGKTEAEVGYTKPDYVPPFHHPKPFPDAAEQAALAKARNSIIIPIGDRTVVAHEDRLRNPGTPFDPLNMYPLVAPADKIKPGPWAVAGLDRIPHNYNKFLAQAMERDASRTQEKELLAFFSRVDKDQDNAVSPQEYDAEVRGRQGKTADQAAALWKQYHITADPDMTKGEFMKLAATGFDLGRKFIPRKDITVTLVPTHKVDMGFWGGGNACANGTFVNAVAIKVKPNAQTGDNTALNCVKFRCSDGKEIQTAEGPDGAWTAWAECLPNQLVYSVSVRVHHFSPGQDNTAINDLMFQCRSAGQDKSTTLMFGENTPQQNQQGFVFVNGQYVLRNSTSVDDKMVVVGKGQTANEGGWSEELSCGTNGALCGAQGRLLAEPNNTDNMGATDFRFFCCAASLDCSAPCQNPSSTQCFACKSKTFTIAQR